MAKKYYKSQKCLNCDTQIGDVNYCPNCGQVNSDKRQSLSQLISDFVGEYFTFDSRFFRSFIPLLTKPGHLTHEYNRGKRISYVFPLRLYMFTTFLLFLIITIQNKISGPGLEERQKETIAAKDSFNTILNKYQFEQRESFEEEIDSIFTFNIKAAEPQVIIGGTPSDSLQSGFAKKIAEKLILIGKRGNEGWRMFWMELVNQMPKLMFLLLPLFALILKLLYVRQKILYINHLIFSLHVHTVLFLYLIIANLIPTWYIILLTVLGSWLYLFIAFRKVYQQTRWMTFIKLNTLLFFYNFVLLAGFTLLIIFAVFTL